MIKISELIGEWCEANNQWQGEVYGGGYPRMVTRARLYFAGRALFELAGIEPLDGIYFKNCYNETPDMLNLLSEELNRRKSNGPETK